MSNFDEVELEHDFCLLMNMMLGESYEQAQKSAKNWMADAREESGPVSLAEIRKRRDCQTD